MQAEHAAYMNEGIDVDSTPYEQHNVHHQSQGHAPPPSVPSRAFNVASAGHTQQARGRLQNTTTSSGVSSADQTGAWEGQYANVLKTMSSGNKARFNNGGGGVGQNGFNKSVCMRDTTKQFLDEHQLEAREEGEKWCVRDCPFCHDTKGEEDNLK
jgi:hypothetical protein